MAFQFESSGALRALSAEELLAADNDSAVIVRDSGTLEDGTPFWLYIAVRPSRYKEFMDLTAQRQSITYNDYGIILRHGFGSGEVPAEIIEEMKRNYGCDEHFLAVLAQDVSKAQDSFIKQNEDQRIGDIVAMLKKKQEDPPAE